MVISGWLPSKNTLYLSFVSKWLEAYKLFVVVFVELIKQQGNMNDLEVDTYKHHFEIYKNPLPELTIVLDTPPTECKDRMTKRGRGMEEGVPLDYLQLLGDVYNKNFNKLGVKTVKKFFNTSPSATAEEIITLAESEFAEYDR